MLCCEKYVAGTLISSPITTFEEQFGTDNVSVVLEWDEEYHTAYNVITSPHVNLWYVRESVIHLIVPYNTIVNVSVVATLCNHSITNMTQLRYGEL